MTEIRKEQPHAPNKQIENAANTSSHNFTNPFPNKMNHGEPIINQHSQGGFHAGINKRGLQNGANNRIIRSKNQMLQQVQRNQNDDRGASNEVNLHKQIQGQNFNRTFTLGNGAANLSQSFPHNFHQETDFETRQANERSRWNQMNQQEEAKSITSSEQLQKENAKVKDFLANGGHYRQTSDYTEGDELKKAMLNQKQFMAAALKDARHDPSYWKENPQRMALLQDVLLEPLDEDSEDESGQPRYIRSKDDVRRKLEKELMNIKEKLKRENKKPNEIASNNEVMKLEYEIEKREKVWLDEQKLKRMAEQKLRQKSIGFDSEESSEKRIQQSNQNNQKETVGINQLNIAVNNVSSSRDIQIEMGILAQRERRRFNQCRRLGIKVPSSYIRVNRLTAMPKYIQEELVKYPSAILDDSEYEDDQQVLQNYDGHFVDYIMKNSQKHRDELDSGAPPRRIYEARRKAGDLYTDINSEITNIAIDQMLADHNLKKGLTKEKIDGTYKRHELFNDEDYKKTVLNRYFVETLKQFYDQYGVEIFDKNPDFKEQVLRRLGGQASILKAHPEIIKGMYKDAKDLNEVPEALRIDNLFQSDIQDYQDQDALKSDSGSNKSLQIRKSPLLVEYQEHLQRRSASFQKDRNDEGEDNNKGLNNGSFGHIDMEAAAKNIFLDNHQNKASSNMIDKKWDQESPLQQDRSLQQFRNAKDQLDLLSSSESSENVSTIQQKHLQMIRDDSLREQQAQMRVIANRILREQERQEFAKWNQDFLYDILKDQGEDALIQMSEQLPRRKLSRREMTDQAEWPDLPSSAEQSDESIQKAQFTHPLLIAKQRLAGQKIIPEKKKNTQRRPQEILVIEGKRYRWDDFKREVLVKANEHNSIKGQNQLITQREFLLNEGDRKHEKLLTWTIDAGFISENSDDERTAYNREIRFYKRDIEMTHGIQVPILLSRLILPFEYLLLKLGGAQLLKKHTGKKFEIDSPESQMIYAWYDPNLSGGDPFRQSFGDFLLAPSQEEFSVIYNKERLMQLSVMNQDARKVQFSIFSNEMIQLYEVMRRLLKQWKCQNELEMNLKLEFKSLMPKSRREYEENLNFEEFWQFEMGKAQYNQIQREIEVSNMLKQKMEKQQDLQDFNQKPRRERSAFESDSLESRQGQPQPSIPLPANLEEKKQSQSSDQEIFENYQDAGGYDSYQGLDANDDFANEQQDIGLVNRQKEEDQIQRVKEDGKDAKNQENSLLPSPIASKQKPRDSLMNEAINPQRQITPRKIESTPIQIEPPRIFIPDSKGPDYEILQQRLVEFDRVQFVDDSEEITSIINESLLIRPEHIERYLIPQLDKVVEQSNGRLKGYFIWPQYKKDGYDKIYPLGRRYPKRLKLYQPQPEDLPIIIKGIEVGYLITSVPYLFPDSWTGQGVPLQNQRNLPKMSPIKKQPEREVNQKPRNPPAANQANRGRQASNPRVGQPNKKRRAGEAQIDQDDIPGATEYKALPFLKAEQNLRDVFERLSTKHVKLDRGQTEYQVVLEIKPLQKISSDTPTSTPLAFQNVDKIEKIFRLTHRERNGQEKSAMINNQFKLGSNNYWTLKNDDVMSRQILIKFIV